VERVREVIDLKHTPAFDVADGINELLRSERPSPMDEVVVVPEPIGNRLLVSSPPAMFEKIVELIKGIDIQPRCVVIETLIAIVDREDKTASKSPLADFRESTPSEEKVAALIEQLKKAPGVEILARPTVMTADNQPAFIQLGQRVPRAQTVVTESGTTSSVEYENVGLIFGVTARISGDDLVTMEIDLEKSEVHDDDPEADSATPTMDVITAQTTVVAKSGHAAVLGGLKAESSSAAKELIMIVIPKINQTH
jgi:type II secretory pathway component GspD/PulD (secretin)